MRHGESEWNRLNLFTGWVDVPLSVKGIEEALAAGQSISHLPVDIIFTSSLSRAITTALLAMSKHGGNRTPVVTHTFEGKMENWGHIYGEQAKKQTIPLICAWELNERMYGELQGINKAEAAARFGADQVQIWRRSYDIAPPNGESLEMTAARALPYFQDQIVPQLEMGKNVLVSAHGNSLRAILMQLEDLDKEQIVKLEIPTGQPIVYQFNTGRFTKSSIS